MNISSAIRARFIAAQQSSIVAPLFNLFMGRCTFFAIVFTIVGIIGWFRGRDLTSYALFVGAVQALLVVHSWKQDVNDQKQAQQQMQTVNVTVDPNAKS